MKLLNLVPQSLLSASVVGVLFLLMAALIDTDFKKPIKVLPDIKDIHLGNTQITEPVPEIEKPEKPEVEQIVETIREPNGPEPTINTNNRPGRPKVSLTNNTVSLSINAGELLPLVKIQPKYPRRALARNIEGFAIAEFDVDKLGRVVDCKVVAAQTTTGSNTRVFDQAACNAAEKFRYRPKIVDGQAVEVRGVQNRFVFEIED